MDMLDKIIFGFSRDLIFYGVFFLIKLFMKLVGYNEEYSYRSFSYTF